MVKVISLSDRAYAVLKRFKGSRLSFSEAVLARFSEEDEEKTEGTEELLKWIESRRRGSRKIPLASRVDEILYGASR